MSFKYALDLPAEGANKLTRFKAWAKANAPEIAFSLPPQVPIEATKLTVRLQTVEDRVLIRLKFPQALP